MGNKYSSAPTTSIIIPTFNRKELLDKAVSSVLNQTYQNFEVLVIDDGSDKDVIEFTENLCARDTRIRLIKRNRLPKGAPTCRNIGMKESLGTFVIFWDSDDYMMPWCVEERLAYIRANTMLDFAIFQLFNYDRISCRYTLRCNPIAGDHLKRFLTYATSWGTSAVIWRKSSLEKIGGWNEHAKSWQDGEIHIKAISKNFRFKWGSKIPDGIIISNSSNDNITTSISLAEKWPNRLDVLNSLMKYLSDDNKELAIKAVKARMWYEAKGAPFSEVKSVSRAAKLHSIFSKTEEFTFNSTLAAYSYAKRIKGVRGIFYRLFVGPKFNSFSFFKRINLNVELVNDFRQKLVSKSSSKSVVLEADYLAEPEKTALFKLLTEQGEN